MIREWENGETAFQYEEVNGEIRLLGWKGCGICARIPEKIGEMPVSVIGRKAFLSNKRIQEVFLPESIREVEEWAFAYCSRLAYIAMPRKDILFGKGAFLQCERLEQIETEGAQPEEKESGVGQLLAAAVHKLDAPYLLNLQEAGKEEWIQKWDARMMQLLTTPDREGYSKTILCGEEDYGSMENNLDYFLSQKRRSKVRLALLRLRYDKGLAEETREYLKRYLRTYAKGCSFEESWLVVKEEYGTQKVYYDLLYLAGALTEQNFDEVLCDMGNELAEMKAYLLKNKESWFGSSSVFDAFTL